MIENSIEQLIRLIEHEIGLYGNFLECTLRQREALIHNVEREISETTIDQDRLLRQISATERSSQAVLAKCAEQIGLDADNMSMAALAERLDGAQSRQLIRAAHQVLETGTRVRSETIINRHLIGNLVELTDYCLRSVAGLTACAPAYRSDGSVSIAKQLRSLTLDSRV
jgi:hypothetical protein